MSLQELKTLMVDRINQSENEAALVQFAQLIQTVLGKTEAISQNEQEVVELGRKELAEGKGLTHDEVFQNIRIKLTEKYGNK